jgi:Lar family restriction alleviation protein
MVKKIKRQKKEIKPKPCPFCGKRKITADNAVAYAHGEVAVICPRCCAAGPFGENEEKAIAIWNKRNGGRQCQR